MPREITAQPKTKRHNRNPDRVTASEIDPVAYTAQQFACLDDEIEDLERWESQKPFPMDEIRYVPWMED